MNNLEAAKARLSVLQLPVTKRAYRNSLEAEVATDLEAALRVVERAMIDNRTSEGCVLCDGRPLAHEQDCPLVWWEQEAR